MNLAQRRVFAFCLGLVGCVIAFVAFEWDSRPPRDLGVRLVGFYESGNAPPCRDGSANCAPWDRSWDGIPPPPPGFVILGERQTHGIFVRRIWGAEALLWGTVLPLLFIGAAAVVSLGGRRE